MQPGTSILGADSGMQQATRCNHHGAAIGSEDALDECRQIMVAVTRDFPGSTRAIRALRVRDSVNSRLPLGCVPIANHPLAKTLDV